MPLEVLVRAVGEAWAEAWPAVFWVTFHLPGLHDLDMMMFGGNGGTVDGWLHRHVDEGGMRGARKRARTQCEASQLKQRGTGSRVRESGGRPGGRIGSRPTGTGISAAAYPTAGVPVG